MFHLMHLNSQIVFVSKNRVNMYFDVDRVSFDFV